MIWSNLLTIVIAGAVALIALGQLAAARYRLRMDLFDKRYEVFRRLVGATLGRLEEINAFDFNNPDPNMPQQSAFWDAQREASLLFGSEVAAGIKEIEDGLKAVGMRWAEFKTGAGSTAAAHKAWQDESLKVVGPRMDNLFAMVDRYLAMRDAFKTYVIWG